jgi:hypothetical protein
MRFAAIAAGIASLEARPTSLNGASTTAVYFGSFLREYLPNTQSKASVSRLIEMFSGKLDVAVLEKCAELFGIMRSLSKRLSGTSASIHLTQNL